MTGAFSSNIQKTADALRLAHAAHRDGDLEAAVIYYERAIHTASRARLFCANRASRERIYETICELEHCIRVISTVI